MPRNVRNFWIELSVDGKKETVETGPVSKTGGFYMTIKMRDKGGIDTPIRIDGRATEEGKISLSIVNHSNGKIVFEKETER